MILVDARHGVVAQTKRHAFICSLLGIRQLVLAVNKMDLVGYEGRRFAAIAADYLGVCREAGRAAVARDPAFGAVRRQRHASLERMPWYRGPALLDHLETVERRGAGGGDARFRFPVQWVNRPDARFRGFSGTIASGSVAPGDPVTCRRLGPPTRVAGSSPMTAPLDRAGAGDAVTLVLDDEIDIARGDVLADPRDPPEFVDQFAAH